MIKVAMLTVSDSCARGEREDLSGPAIREVLSAGGFQVCEERIVADDRDAIVRELVRFADECACDLVFTTGGTGLGPRDVTPEATASVCEQTGARVWRVDESRGVQEDAQRHALPRHRGSAAAAR